MSRKETRSERLDRNWLHLLQELRVLQTGVQLLTGFLLILPFQQGFSKLDSGMRIVYLVVVFCAIGSTILAIAPVAWHRLLFRRRRMQDVVGVAHYSATIALLLLGVALTGVTILIVGAILSTTTAIIAGVVVATAFVTMWLLIPWLNRQKDIK